MTALHFAGNFNAEISHLNNNHDVIASKLKSLYQTVEGMTYWKDENSEKFKVSVKDLITELEKENEESNAEGKRVLNEVAAALNIYAQKSGGSGLSGPGGMYR